jgi:hypothetical protein
MREIFKQIRNIIGSNSEAYELNGIITYLLTSEEEPYKLYRLNLANNEAIIEGIRYNINNVYEDAIFLDYSSCTSPDGIESISFLKNDEIPNYQQLRDKIIKDEANPINTRVFNEISSTIKGYAVKVLYTNRDQTDPLNIQETQGSLIVYSVLNQGNILKPQKQPLLRFGNEEGDTLEEVREAFLKLNDRITVIDYDQVTFIMHGYFFENLFKYEDHISEAASIMLGSLNRQSLIANLEILENRCQNNKNFRKKLYKIHAKDSINSITIDRFRELKNRHGENLYFDLNEDNTISIQLSNASKSIDHILRIYNDELAETFITGTSIFANQQIPVANF